MAADQLVSDEWVADTGRDITCASTKIAHEPPLPIDITSFVRQEVVEHKGRIDLVVSDGSDALVLELKLKRDQESTSVTSKLDKGCLQIMSRDYGRSLVMEGTKLHRFDVVYDGATGEFAAEYVEHVPVE